VGAYALAFFHRHGGDPLRNAASCRPETISWRERIFMAETYRLLHKIVNRAGIEVTLASSTDLAKFEGGHQRRRLSCSGLKARAIL